MADLNSIIKKHKESLTKAQIRALIKATERYKQTYAANRAQAYSVLHQGMSATRRGLQNAGLAGRRGKLISGQETAAELSAQQAYIDYNRQLVQGENAYAEWKAAQMMQQNAQAEAYRRAQEAARRAAEEQARKASEEQAKKQTEQIANQAYNNYVWDSRHPGSPFMRNPYMYTKDDESESQRQAEIRKALTGGRSDRDPLSVASDAAKRAQEAAQKKNPILWFAQQQVRNAQEKDFVQRYQAASKDAEQYIKEQQAIIDKASAVTSPSDSVGKILLQKSDIARKNIARKESELARLWISKDVPAEVGQMLNLSDDDFDVQYDAIKKAYPIIIPCRRANMARHRKSLNGQRRCLRWQNAQRNCVLRILRRRTITMQSIRQSPQGNTNRSVRKAYILIRVIMRMTRITERKDRSMLLLSTSLQVS